MITPKQLHARTRNWSRLIVRGALSNLRRVVVVDCEAYGVHDEYTYTRLRAAVSILTDIVNRWDTQKADAQGEASRSQST